MTIPSDSQLERIIHADLIAMVRSLMVRVDSLEKENQKISEEIERLKRTKANSQNSSQRPLRDQKPNAPSGTQKKKHGSP